MFDKDRFLEYMKDNFKLDDFSIRLIESLAKYGEETCNIAKNQLICFLWDILSEVEPSIDFYDIDQFYYEEGEIKK